MPVNYSLTSRGAERALRLAADSAISPDPAVWNFDDSGFSAVWSALSEEERRRRIEALVGEFLGKRGLADAAVIAYIDVHHRVFLEFKRDFPPAEKPALLMQVERHVRSGTGERVELFVAEMKDNNRLRRL